MDKWIKLASVFWEQWEPHLAFFGAVGVLALLHHQAKAFDPVVEVIILVVAGGPAARDAAVSVIQAWKGTGASK